METAQFRTKDHAVAFQGLPHLASGSYWNNKHVKIIIYHCYVRYTYIYIGFRPDHGRGRAPAYPTGYAPDYLYNRSFCLFGSRVWNYMTNLALTKEKVSIYQILQQSMNKGASTDMRSILIILEDNSRLDG